MRSYRHLCPCPSRQTRASPWPPGRSRWGGWSPCRSIHNIIQETFFLSPRSFTQKIAKGTMDQRHPVISQSTSFIGLVKLHFFGMWCNNTLTRGGVYWNIRPLRQFAPRGLRDCPRAKPGAISRAEGCKLPSLCIQLQLQLHQKIISLPNTFHLSPILSLLIPHNPRHSFSYVYIPRI